MENIIVGEIAPSFALPNQNDDIVTLDTLKGKKIVLYFYPKDNTSGCTAEACSLKSGEVELLKMGYTIVGVSPDTIASHQKFIAKQELPFMLLSDTDKVMSTAYGVWGEKKLYGKTYMGVFRKTFLLDENGVVTHIIDKVKTKEHFEQIVKIIKN